MGTTPEHGTKIEPMLTTLKEAGLAAAVSTKTTLRQLTAHLSKGVAILHVDNDHFVVCHARRGNIVYIMDPMGLPNRMTTKVLRKRWKGWAILAHHPITDLFLKRLENASKA